MMGILDRLGQFFNEMSLPYEIMDVFDGFIGVWDAIPAVLRSVLILIFGVACLLAVVKMLF